jgi:voltage-gated potassium channel
MRLKVPNPIRRPRTRFADDPASIGNAVRLIIGVVLIAVFVGSAAIWLLDRRDFPDYGTALWFSLQTVTTVGYGDVTPTTAWGRVVGGIVMVIAIGAIAVITAAITSTFVEAAQRRRRSADQSTQQDAFQRLEKRLDEISQRLDRIEGRPGVDEGQGDDPPGD